MLQRKPWGHISDFEKKYWFREFWRIGAAGRLSRFSVEIVLSPNTVTFRSRTSLCFRNFYVSEEIGIRNGAPIMILRGEFYRFRVLKHFLEENSWVSENFCYRNIIRLRRGGRGITWFSVEIVLSHSAATFRRETPLWFRNHEVCKDFDNKRGRGVSRFVVDFFCLTVAKPFVE